MLAYFSAACMVAAPAASLANLLAMKPEPAARLASQCAQLLLRCGTAALQAQQLSPPVTRLWLVDVLLPGLEQVLLMARSRAAGDSLAAFVAMCRLHWRWTCFGPWWLHWLPCPLNYRG